MLFNVKHLNQDGYYQFGQQKIEVRGDYAFVAGKAIKM
jgi:hypothetical protein